MRLLVLCSCECSLRLAVLSAWPSVYICIYVVYTCVCVWAPTGNTSSAWLVVGTEDMEPQQPLSGCHIWHNAFFPTATCLRSNHYNLR